MRARLAAGMLAMVLIPVGAAASQRESCATLDDCLVRLSHLASIRDQAGGYSTSAELALNDRLLRFPGAVPRLVPLLADPDRRVAEIAASALADARHIDPKYLPQIIAGIDRGIGWLPAALGRVPSDQAAHEAVIRYLAADIGSDNPEAYAIQLSGVRAVPAILDIARCREPCGDGQLVRLASVLEEMDAASRQRAAPGLMAILRDVARTPGHANGVLAMIGALGNAATQFDDELSELGQLRPELQWPVERTLIKIGSRRTAEIFSRRLDAQVPAGYELLMDLAEVGLAAHDAGPAVVRQLQGSDQDSRRYAARTLGFIGYEPAWQDLVQAMHDPTDVVLNWTAAESLGRVHARRAMSALQQVADHHWYPEVRWAGRTAMRHIHDNAPYPTRLPQYNFAMYFDSIRNPHEPIPGCQSLKFKAALEPAELKLYARSDSARLGRLAYPIDMNEDTGPVGDEKTSKFQTPDLARRVSGGWLTGSDRGEWGGEVMYIGDDGLRQLVLQCGVEDIYALGDRIVASCGAAHLANLGELVEITRNPEGHWTPNPWRVLPGAPRQSWILESGELLLRTEAGGDIVVDANGLMRMATCKAKPAKPAPH